MCAPFLFGVGVGDSSLAFRVGVGVGDKKSPDLGRGFTLGSKVSARARGGVLSIGRPS